MGPSSQTTNTLKVNVPSLDTLPPADALPPLPPPPEALAPWLFFPPGRTASGAGLMSSSNSSAAQSQQPAPSSLMPNSPPPAPPASTAAAEGPPAASPPPPPPLPDAAAKSLDGKNKDKEAASKDEGIAKVTSDVPVHGFDDQTIRMLNARLEDPDWQKRADAAMDFFLVLQANPSLNKRPDYKAYVDAFALKILNDPIAVVHEPILLAIETGLYKHPSPDVMDDLAELKASSGLLGLEPQMIEDSLRDLSDDEAKEWQDSQKKEQLSGDTLPPAPAGTGMDSPVSLPAAASLPPTNTPPDTAPPLSSSSPSSDPSLMPTPEGDWPPAPPPMAAPSKKAPPLTPLPDLSTPYIAASQGLHGPRGQTLSLPKWRLPWQAKPKPAQSPALQGPATLPLPVSPTQQQPMPLPLGTNPVGGQLNVVSS